MKKLLVIFMLALCSCSEEGENISTEDNLIEITFATDWKAQAEQGGFYQALAAGLYEKNGLKVKIIQGSANVNVPRLIASNSVEFGIGSNSFIPLNMVANKIPGKAVMAIFQKDPQIIMTHPDSDIRNLKDMRDLPIMISDASIGAFWLWLKSKYDFNDNQIRKKTFSLAPFLSNKSSIQQGYLTSEPFLVEREAGFTPRVFLLADYGYPSYGTMVLASSNVLKNNPEIVKAFVDASIEGWRQYIYDDPSLGNELIMLENNEMKEDILLQAIKKIRNYELVSNEISKGLDIGLMTDIKWESFFKTMSINGVYEKDLEWRESFTLDFINKEN
ncbi:MAG: nitrate ABC transporter substrate-binding protein [Rickettsiales bacterium TMED269]|nr:nitrate ABC transporter substrate-binding protein [Rhodobiaceae bacterium]OUX40669.1 MAG: nitrate ABC transporter substrate-binding protein [Rickettsiales bacterium TMED269]